MLRSFWLLLLSGCTFDVHKVDVAPAPEDLSAAVDLAGEDLAESPDLSESVDLLTPDLVASGDLAITPEIKVTRDNMPPNLTMGDEGTSDWMHFGLVGTQVDRKDFVPQKLTEMTTGGANRYGLFGNPNISWNDGTPTGSATNSTAGIYVGGLNNGFTITAPATTGKQTMRLYVGEYRGTGTLVAHLSDGSIADVTTNHTNNGGLTMSRFTIEFKATMPATLTVTWKLTNDNGTGTVDLRAVTLF